MDVTSIVGCVSQKTSTLVVSRVCDRSITPVMNRLLNRIIRTIRKWISRANFVKKFLKKWTCKFECIIWMHFFIEEYSIIQGFNKANWICFKCCFHYALFFSDEHVSLIPSMIRFLLNEKEVSVFYVFFFVSLISLHIDSFRCSWSR